jgi:ABC-2 type transport system ATP-binding protein
MNDTVFSARNLTKLYKKHPALDGVNMEIKRGDIYGFVGENGAGKTTLIRILAGLAEATGGEISLFGQTDKLHLQRKRMGGIVESPVYYPDLSAAENLEIFRLQRGIPGRECIAQALRDVELKDTGRKKVKNFSLGMKQRLSLASAIMANPELLVLDEPANGLDPVGIVGLRELIKRLNRERGVTVLISSHILGELYQLATCYGFIHKGKLLEQLTLEQLDERCRKHLRIVVDDTAKAAVVLETVLHTDKYDVQHDSVIRLYDMLDKSGKVNSALVTGGVIVSEISAMGDGLESFYMNLIGGRK